MHQEYYPQLRRNFEKWGVEVVGVDMDDTIIPARGDFKGAIHGAAAALAGAKSWEAAKKDEVLGSRAEQARVAIDEILWGLRKEFCVAPLILELSVMIAGRMVGCTRKNDRRVTAARKAAREAYVNRNPKPFTGAIEMVDAFNACLPSEGRTLLVSHSEIGRITERCRKAGFTGKFFGYHAMDVRRTKSEQWEEFWEDEGVEPGTFLMVGDGLLADIKPVVVRGGRGVHVLNINGEAFGVDTDSGEEIPKARFFTAKTTADVVKVLSTEVSL